MNIKTDAGSSFALIAEIEKETKHRIDEIIKQAKIQAEQIISTAKKQAETIIKKEKEKAQRFCSMMEQKAEATFNMELRKMRLQMKQRFADLVLEKVHSLAPIFRQKPEYRTFLQKAIMEGIMVIDREKIIVKFSPEDKIFFDAEMEKEITEMSQQLFKKRFSISLVEGEFKEIGIIVCSEDNLITYENTFSARLKRMYEKIYSELLSEELNG